MLGNSEAWDSLPAGYPSFCHLSKLQETWVPCMVLGQPHLPLTHSSRPRDRLAQTGCLWKLQESNDQAPRTSTRGRYLPYCLSLTLDRSQPRPSSRRHWGECWRDRLGQAVAHASSSQFSAEAPASHKDVQSRHQQSQDHKSVRGSVCASLPGGPALRQPQAARNTARHPWCRGKERFIPSAEPCV